VIVDADELRSIKRGLRTHVHVPDRDGCKHRPGDLVRLRTGRRDPGVQVTVTEVVQEQDEPFDWKVSFRRGDLKDRPRLLAYSGTGRDYTEEPAMAMRGEPEAVTDVHLERFGREAQERDRARAGAVLAGRAARLELQARSLLARPRTTDEDELLRRVMANLAGLRRGRRGV
jgi:hypothetical protein